MLSGPVREIQILSHPSCLILQDCPDLEYIHDLDAGSLHVCKAPKLREEGPWLDGMLVRRFNCG
jgi:hypothetical protein